MIDVAVLTSLVEGFEPDNDGAARDSKVKTLALLRTVSRPLQRDTFVPGHVTASGLVVSPDGGRVLLVLHRRLGRWLQPGGHLEPSDFDIAGAARREVLEETSVQLDDGAPPVLVGIDVHSIPAYREEPAHLHHDLVFRFVARSDALSADESRRVAWCDWERLGEFAADQAVQRAARRARR